MVGEAHLSQSLALVWQCRLQRNLFSTTILKLIHITNSSDSFANLVTTTLQIFLADHWHTTWKLVVFLCLCFHILFNVVLVVKTAAVPTVARTVLQTKIYVPLLAYFNAYYTSNPPRGSFSLFKHLNFYSGSIQMILISVTALVLREKLLGIWKSSINPQHPAAIIKPEAPDTSISRDIFWESRKLVKFRCELNMEIILIIQVSSRTFSTYGLHEPKRLEISCWKYTIFISS